MSLEQLMQTQEKIKQRLLDLFDKKLVHLIGYGSFFMQKTSLDPDKKPDFIVVVEDYSVHQQLGDLLDWKDKDVQQNIELNQGSVNFYNINDNGMRFKIGIVSKPDMADLLSENSDDLYLSGRLSKSVHPLYSRTHFEEKQLEKSLEQIRKRFVKWSFELQKGKLTKDDILKTYLAISYMAEMYRYVTIDRKKPGEILEKTRQELIELLAPQIQEYAEENSLSSGFLEFEPIPENPQKKVVLYRRFLRYSLAGLRHSFHNSKTNKYSNDPSSSSFRYILRKIKKMLGK